MITRQVPLFAAALFCAAGSSSLVAQNQNATPAAPTPNVNLTVSSPVTELAAGYAAAVGQMSLKNLAIHYRQGTGVVVFKGIRSVRALSGVLLVTFSAGDIVALNAENIVLIADGNRVPEPKG